MNEVIYFAIVCGAIALIYGLITAKSVINSDAGLCSQDGCIVQSAVVFEYIAVNDPQGFASIVKSVS